MDYVQLLNDIHFRTGMSRRNASDALDALIESIAVHLPEQDRKKFANQLPERLANIALSVYPTQENTSIEILPQFMKNQSLKATQAKQQIAALWTTLKNSVPTTLIEQVKASLSSKNAALLR